MSKAPFKNEKDVLNITDLSIITATVIVSGKHDICTPVIIVMPDGSQHTAYTTSISTDGFYIKVSTKQNGM